MTFAFLSDNAQSTDWLVQLFVEKFENPSLMLVAFQISFSVKGSNIYSETKDAIEICNLS